ncbi:methyltransferase domain-containing protein [Candidatus Poriferisodalis sp.]|uniref:methyltransferase domain-containing protein n=1 Tax=Candidatus Poriferisodalis sp. TaxID=3101277 RepID=UPI003B015C7D
MLLQFELVADFVGADDSVVHGLEDLRSGSPRGVTTLPPMHHPSEPSPASTIDATGSGAASGGQADALGEPAGGDVSPSSPVRTVDVYTHGHQPAAVAQHARRTAEDCAAFARDVIRPESQILDVGCGPASITVGLARWASDGHVTGIEPGGDILAAAADTVAGASVANVTIAEASVYELPYGDNAFDVAYAHQVCQHLSDPVTAIREMARVVRPGGWVAVRDSDYSTMQSYPSSEQITRWREVYRTVCRHNGAEPDAGRHLYAWFREAGLPQVQMSGVVQQFWTDETRQNWGCSWAERCLHTAFARQAVEYGCATRDELEWIAAGWRAWADNPDAYFHYVHGQALAQVV